MSGDQEGQSKKRKNQRNRAQRVKKICLTEDEAQEFMRIVRDDLVFLKSLNFAKPSRTEVRIASSVLRRLLHEGIYQAAWTLAGLEDQPKVSAIDLAELVADVPSKYIHYAYAGGAKTDGANHVGYTLLEIQKAEIGNEGYEAAAKRVSKLLKTGVTKEFTLREFTQSPSVISGRAAISRLGMVQYVANKLGGVHWDRERGKWSSPIGSRHRLLDEGHMIVGRLPAPLYEVLSIAQDIATSSDVDRFIERVSAVAPEAERATNVLSFREGRRGKYADMTFNAKAEE